MSQRAQTFLLLVFLLLLLFALHARYMPSVYGQEPQGAAAAAVHTVALPMVSNDAFPAPMPAVVGEYLDTPVNLDVWIGADGGHDWMHADSLLTYQERGDDGALYSYVCYYGTWHTGTGAADCKQYQ